MRFCVFLHNLEISRTMALLQNVMIATHREQQQATDLSFDGSDAARRAVNNVENRGGQLRYQLLEMAFFLRLHVLSN